MNPVKVNGNFKRRQNFDPIRRPLGVEGIKRQLRAMSPSPEGPNIDTTGKLAPITAAGNGGTASQGSDSNT